MNFRIKTHDIFQLIYSLSFKYKELFKNLLETYNNIEESINGYLIELNKL